MKVYVVANCGVEHYAIQHICVAEATARKRFEEVRKEMLAEAIRMQEFCAERDKQKSRERDNLYDEIVEILTNTTFDNQLSDTSDHVVCDQIKLED